MSRPTFSIRPTAGRLAIQVLAVASLVASAPAFAGAWSESGDAGQTVATAQTTSGSAGALGSIAGSLSSLTDVDMFVISITNPAQFMATTVGNTAMDTQLFLFTLAGAAVYANDDADGLTLQSTLPAGNAFAAGLYLLGISLAGNDPVNAVNDFLFAGGFSTDVRGPASNISPAELADFTGGTVWDEEGAYSITLRGAEFAKVPEPTTGLLAALGIGLCGLPSLRARRRRSA